MKKRYGATNTNIILTDKALRGYLSEDPLEIYEISRDDQPDTYEIKDAGGWHRDLTAQDVIEWLEAIQGQNEEWARQERLDEYAEAAQEIVDAGNYAAAVALMDDDLREELHVELAPCTDAEFLAAYMERHAAKFGEAFTI